MGGKIGKHRNRSVRVLAAVKRVIGNATPVVRSGLKGSRPFTISCGMASQFYAIIATKAESPNIQVIDFVKYKKAISKFLFSFLFSIPDDYKKNYNVPFRPLNCPIRCFGNHQNPIKIDYD